MHCLSNKLADPKLIGRLADDYNSNKGQKMYTEYMEEIISANNKKKGDTAMVCEGLFRLYGTSSKEIDEKAREEERKKAAEYYQPKIDALSSANDELSSAHNLLSS